MTHRTTHTRWLRRAGLTALTVAALAVTIAGCGNSRSGSGSGASSASAPQCAAGTTAPMSAAARTTGNPMADTIPSPTAANARYGRSSTNPCVYTSAGNLSVNLKNCPSTWSNTQGITAHSIKLFTSMPHSGALAAYGEIGTGLQAYLKYVNDHGGIGGRKVSLKIMDDQYQPDLTRQNVQTAVQADSYAASFAVVGSPNNLDIADYMNQQCMPQLMVGASDDNFGNPKVHPWTNGFGLDYYDESAMWAKWLHRRYPHGASAVGISIDNQLGASYFTGFKLAANKVGIKIAGDEVNPTSAPSIQNQVTSAAATHAKVAVISEAGTFCTQAIADIEKSSWHPTIIVAQPCAQIQTVFAPLAQQGATGNGVNVIRYYYAPTDPDNPNKSFAAFYKKTMTSQGLSATDAQLANGWFWGWYVVQVLKDAQVMKGGLTRANILMASWMYNSVYPLMIKGARGHMDGDENAYPFGQGRMYTYTGASTKSTGHFVPAGPLINNAGQLRDWEHAQKVG